MANNFGEDIKQLVSEITEVSVEKLTLDADFFADLNIDSLKAIEIVAAFEKKYRIVIPEQDIPEIRSIRKITEFIESQKKTTK